MLNREGAELVEFIKITKYFVQLNDGVCRSGLVGTFNDQWTILVPLSTSTRKETGEDVEKKKRLFRGYVAKGFSHQKINIFRLN